LAKLSNVAEGEKSYLHAAILINQQRVL